jgi:hypothetical protein
MRQRKVQKSVSTTGQTALLGLRGYCKINVADAATKATEQYDLEPPLRQFCNGLLPVDVVSRPA